MWISGCRTGSATAFEWHLPPGCGHSPIEGAHDSSATCNDSWRAFRSGWFAGGTDESGHSMGTDAQTRRRHLRSTRCRTLRTELVCECSTGSNQNANRGHTGTTTKRVNAFARDCVASLRTEGIDPDTFNTETFAAD